MRNKLLLKRFATILMLLMVSVYSFAQATLIISKVADPKDNYKGRFVQLYNTGTTAVDLAAGNWYLAKQVNGGSLYDVQLTGTIDPGSTYVIAGYSDFSTLYGFDANLTSSQISGNGDDGYYLYQGGDHSSGTLVDAYGVMDEDGTGTAWEYTDGEAVRNADVNAPNTTWTASEWTITRPANIADMNPANFTHGSDTQAPTWSSGFPNISRTEDTHARVGVKLDEKCKVYFIVVPKGSDQPNLDQIKAGVDYGTVTVTFSDSIEVTAAEVPFYEDVTNLTASSDYDVYLFAIDLAGNEQTSEAGLAINTTAARALTFDNPKANDSYNLGDTIKLEWTSSNIDSLIVTIRPVSSLITVVMMDGPFAAADGSYNLIVPKDAMTGDYSLVLHDYYDTTFKQTVTPVSVVDNRTLQMTKPKDNDTVYVGDTLIIRWTSSHIDKVLIGGYASDGGYFMLTGDPDHFDTSSFKPVSAASGEYKFFLPADIGGSIKLDSVLIWDAYDVYQNFKNPEAIHLKGYAAPVYIQDTLPLQITYSLPTFGMTDFMPSSWIGCSFNCDSIVRGTGNLYVKKDDGTVVQTLSASDTNIEMHGDGLSFSPKNSLVPGESYYIEIDSGFVKCADGSKTYAGLSGKKWTFTVASSSIYFSEYDEGSGNNKALEIYNPTGKDVNLDDYVIAGSHNGSGINWDDPVYHFPKGYVLKAGSVFVLANAGASQDVLKVANDTLAYNEGGYVCSFNGDDARVLMKVENNGYDQMWVDAIGEPWNDPGDGWDVAGVTAATKDHTLLRKADVKLGNGGDWGLSAGTDADNSQWIVKDKDYFDNLGKPTVSGFAITFNANMAYDQNFNPKTDSVFIAGNFPDATWNEPGSNPALRMSDADSNGIYTITLNVPSAMALEYKYFVNAGWKGGEWDGGDNRKVNINNDTTLNDIFGYADNKPPMVTVNVPYLEKFDDVTADEAVNLKGWTNVNLATGGKLQWMGKEYNSNKYVQISAYKSPSSGADTAWLITPAINMDNSTDEKLSFDVNVGYWNNDGLKVFISTDYDQTKEGISKATWTDVTSSFTIPSEPAKGYGTFAPAGTLDVSNYTGKMSVAFMYVGDAANSKTTTYQIDNVKVEGTTTGIINNELSNKISLYPNPGNGIFKIALNGTLKGAVTMRIVDITGRVVMEKRFNYVSSTVDVDISQQPSNLYFITLTDAHNTIVKKFMKR